MATSSIVTIRPKYAYNYGGHGSTRAVLDAAAQVQQRYAYDAYGTLHEGVGLTAASAALTQLLYAGEWTNPKTGQQYLRARFYDPSTGRFNRLDPWAGNTSDPQSLHKYLYAHANPVMNVDPTGRWSVAGVTAGVGIATVIAGYTTQYIGQATGSSTAVTVGSWMVTGGFVVAGGALGAMLLPATVPLGIRIAAGVSAPALRALWYSLLGEIATDAKAVARMGSVNRGVSNFLREYGEPVPVSGRIVVRPGLERWWELSRLEPGNAEFRTQNIFLREGDIAYDYEVTDPVSGKAIVTVGKLVDGSTGRYEVLGTFPIRSGELSGLEYENDPDDGLHWQKAILVYP